MWKCDPKGGTVKVMFRPLVEPPLPPVPGRRTWDGGWTMWWRKYIVLGSAATDSRSMRATRPVMHSEHYAGPGNRLHHADGPHGADVPDFFQAIGITPVSVCADCFFSETLGTEGMARVDTPAT